MVTKLHKDVKRKTLRSLFNQDNGKKLIVMLEHGDIIAIRQEKCKTWRRIAINTLYLQLCQRDAEILMKEKAKNRRRR